MRRAEEIANKIMCDISNHMSSIDDVAREIRKAQIEALEWRAAELESASCCDCDYKERVFSDYHKEHEAGQEFVNQAIDAIQNKITELKGEK